MEFPPEPNNLPKISILKGATPNLSAATYCIQEEGHTLGNALRWMLMKNPQVEFCGYRSRRIDDLPPSSIDVSLYPPSMALIKGQGTFFEFTAKSEPKIHVRIQIPDVFSFVPYRRAPHTPDDASSLDALLDALKNLDDLFATIEDAYTKSFHWGTFERFDEIEDGDAPPPASTLSS
ncbi:RNA polymerase subunit AC19 [Tulasnella sp. 403]|nr:RNA polymerase subunit AC19 [Tulasnella sp. 403]